MKTPISCAIPGAFLFILSLCLFQVSWAADAADDKNQPAASDDANNPYHAALVKIDEMKKMPLPMSPVAREELDQRLDGLGMQIAMGLDPNKVQAAIKEANGLYKDFTEVPKPVHLPVTEPAGPSPEIPDGMHSVDPSPTEGVSDTSREANTVGQDERSAEAKGGEQTQPPQGESGKENQGHAGCPDGM